MLFAWYGMVWQCYVQWYGNGMAMIWQLYGNDMAMVRQWHGNGMTTVWQCFVQMEPSSQYFPSEDLGDFPGTNSPIGEGAFICFVSSLFSHQ